MNQFLRSAQVFRSTQFQIREYTDSTKLYDETLLIGIGIIVINPGDSPQEFATLALFTAYALSVVCCFRILFRFGGSTRDLFSLALGRGRLELSQIIAALAFAAAASTILGFYMILNGKADLILLPKILLQCVLACSICGATIFSSPRLVKSPLIPIAYGLTGFIYPVLDQEYSFLGIFFASGDGFYFSKLVVIAISIYLVFKHSQARDYISE